MRGKSGALEMSVGTIVVIVLSMSMLVLGIVLIGNIFTGASDNVLQMNDKVRDQIGALFVEDKKIVVYLSNQIAEIKQDEDWGVAFAVKNLEKGSLDKNLEYVVDVEDASNCGGIGNDAVNSWMQIGDIGSMTLSPGGNYFGIIRFLIPEGTPLCIARFKLVVTDGDSGQAYASAFFDIEVVA